MSLSNNRYVGSLDPIRTVRLDGGRKANSILFSSDSPNLLVGDSDGFVTVFKLSGFEAPEGITVEKQREMLEECIAQDSSMFK